MKISLFITVISLFLFLNVIGCDVDNQDTCGGSFTESEYNDSISAANDFHIIMKNGCSITITGSLGPFGTDDDDYFQINTGTADNIIFLAEWTPAPSILRLYMTKQNGNAEESTIGITGTAAISYNLVQQYRLKWIRLNIAGGAFTKSYTLTIKGFEP